MVFVHQVSRLAPGMANIEAKNTIIKTEIDLAYSKLQELAKGSAYGADDFYVSQKPVITMLNELKNAQYFDWVFTGLKDTGVLERIFIGITTISIIDNSDLLTVAVPIQTGISIPKKLMVGINCKYPLNKHQFKTVLSNLREHISELEFFTILENNENETEARNYHSTLQIEYEDFNPVLQLY